MANVYSDIYSDYVLCVFYCVSLELTGTQLKGKRDLIYLFVPFFKHTSVLSVFTRCHTVILRTLCGLYWTFSAFSLMWISSLDKSMKHRTFPRQHKVVAFSLLFGFRGTVAGGSSGGICSSSRPPTPGLVSEPRRWRVQRFTVAEASHVRYHMFDITCSISHVHCLCHETDKRLFYCVYCKDIIL